MRIGRVMPPIKEPKAWKMKKSLGGDFVRVEAKDQIKPNKYSPRASKAPRNKPHCYSNGSKNEAIIKCRSCLFQTTCQ